jgi:hypothetical protein
VAVPSPATVDSALAADGVELPLSLAVVGVEIEGAVTDGTVT